MTTARPDAPNARSETTLHWFRSDLRIADNPALLWAASQGPLVCVFVFDPRLTAGPERCIPRLRFLLDCLRALEQGLHEKGHRLLVRHGSPEEEIERLALESGAQRVTWNRDYTPFARRRDEEVERRLRSHGTQVTTFKDHVIFEASEVASAQNRAVPVYSPYRKAWQARFEALLPTTESAATLSLEPGQGTGQVEGPAFQSADELRLPDSFGLEADTTEIQAGGEPEAARRLHDFLETKSAHYKRDRDFPARNATSRLSADLRFGTLSIRACFRAGASYLARPESAAGVRKWLDELIWREFYYAVLQDQPHVLSGAHRPAFDALVWDNDPAHFEAFCEGRTGYPFVDAGIRELLATGHMHNRTRMVVASFLTKDLLIDWRLGERFFMRHLVDGDPANNNGGWQWAASTGTDAQPELRIFNPILQSERFDPEGDYIRQWIPELRALHGADIHRPWQQPLLIGDYPPPIVDHAERRQIALERYAAVLAD